MMTYDLSSNLTVDGERNINPMDLMDNSRFYNKALNTFVNQLIAFTLNFNGEINMIDTAYRGANEDDNSLELSGERKSREFRRTGNTLSSEFRLFPNAKIITVPIDDLENDELFAIHDISALGDNESHILEVFNADDLLLSELIVRYVTTTSVPQNIASNASLLLVDRISTIVNEDGETAYKIYGSQRGGMVELICLDYEHITDVVDTLVTGDIIQVVTYGGKISNIRVVFKPDDNDTYFQSTNTYDSETLTMYGEVVNKRGDAITFYSGVIEQSGQRVLRPYDLSTARVSLYDKNKANSVSPSSSSNIEMGDKLFMRLRYARVEDIVIIRD